MLKDFLCQKPNKTHKLKYVIFLTFLSANLNFAN